MSNKKEPEALWGLVSHFVKAGMQAGINWEDTILVFGMAAKALVATAAQHGEKEAEERAQRCFEYGFRQPVKLEYKDGDLFVRSTIQTH